MLIYFVINQVFSLDLVTNQTVAFAIIVLI